MIKWIVCVTIHRWKYMQKLPYYTWTAKGMSIFAQDIFYFEAECLKCGRKTSYDSIEANQKIPSKERYGGGTYV